jgi:hypothetical protein
MMMSKLLTVSTFGESNYESSFCWRRARGLSFSSHREINVHQMKKGQIV